MTDGTFSVNQLPGETVEPISLFEAQLALRLTNKVTSLPSILDYILVNNEATDNN